MIQGLTPLSRTRSIYGVNPFPESIPVARYLEQHSGPDDRILVFGSEPQIYFYAHRRPATTFLYLYPLLEEQPLLEEMRGKFMREVESRRPRYIVYVHIPVSVVTPAQDNEMLFA